MADGALMLTCVTYGRASASVCSVRAVFVVLMWMTMRQITSISSRGNQRFRLDVIAVPCLLLPFLTRLHPPPPPPPPTTGEEEEEEEEREEEEGG